MKQYPIWNNIQACIYKSPKSYGVRKDGVVNVLVGTSSRRSWDFVQHITTHRELEDGSREYRFYVDGKCIKKAILPKKGDKLEFIEV